jgi:hypothetical protein
MYPIFTRTSVMREALMSYMARYDREHYVKRKIRRDI